MSRPDPSIAADTTHAPASSGLRSLRPNRVDWTAATRVLIGAVILTAADSPRTPLSASTEQAPVVFTHFKSEVGMTPPPNVSENRRHVEPSVINPTRTSGPRPASTTGDVLVAPLVQTVFVIPAYNEEHNLPRLFADLERRPGLF